MTGLLGWFIFLIGLGIVMLTITFYAEDDAAELSSSAILLIFGVVLVAAGSVIVVSNGWDQNGK